MFLYEVDLSNIFQVAKQKITEPLHTFMENRQFKKALKQTKKKVQPKQKLNRWIRSANGT